MVAKEIQTLHRGKTPLPRRRVKCNGNAACRTAAHLSNRRPARDRPSEDFRPKTALCRPAANACGRVWGHTAHRQVRLRIIGSVARMIDRFARKAAKWTASN